MARPRRRKADQGPSRWQRLLGNLSVVLAVASIAALSFGTIWAVGQLNEDTQQNCRGVDQLRETLVDLLMRADRLARRTSETETAYNRAHQFYEESIDDMRAIVC